MRKFFFSLTAVAFAACIGAEARAQYNPYGAAQASRQQMPAATAGRYVPSAPVSRNGYGVQPASVAMRPGTTTYAATPAGGLHPVNPPSAQTQRLLLASRTGPTPAPAMASQPVPRPAAAAAPPQQYWNSSVNSLPWDQSNGAQAAQGAQYGGGAPQPDPNMGGYAGGAYPGAGGGGQCCGNSGGGAPCGGGDCGGCAPACGGCCCCGLARHCLWRTTGDLVQHMPHFGTTHGYYYFRPYHVMHVFSQQELATRWGGDPRNPYDNTVFQNIYQQMGVDYATQKARDEANAKANAVQNTPPPVQEYVVPTPVPNYQQGAPSYQSGPQYQGAPQYVPGSDIPPGAMPPGAVMPGPVPQSSAPTPLPAPAVEYVPNK